MDWMPYMAINFKSETPQNPGHLNVLDTLRDWLSKYKEKMCILFILALIAGFLLGKQKAPPRKLGANLVVQTNAGIGSPIRLIKSESKDN